MSRVWVRHHIDDLMGYETRMVCEWDVLYQKNERRTMKEHDRQEAEPEINDARPGKAS